MAHGAAHDDHHDSHGHDDHGGHDHVEFLPALNPAPSIWPFLLALAMGLLPTSGLILIWGGERLHLLGMSMLVVGAVLCALPGMAWFNSVIRDKWLSHFGPVAQNRDLTMGLLLFFISEIAIFGSIFAYYFIVRGTHDDFFRPHLHTSFPAIATLMLISSSFTCEIAHRSLIAGKRGMCKTWLLITLVLGTAFLGMQGYEWGLMINFDNFTVSTNVFGTIFYVATGFHGMHVMGGLIMLIMVYGRLEIGHYTPTRHFSMNAASWYWHLVDVIWIFLFFVVYLI